MNERAPAIFVGHGSPMNAVRDNDWTRAWAALGKSLPRPRAVLAVSAHWYVPFTAVTAMAAPRTIHDFGGFPRELYELRYPAPGDPALAARLQQLLAPVRVEADTAAWGLDHGAWVVLRRMFPEPTVPVVQLSIDETLPPTFHYALGERLRPLREEGVLILGSGDVVHNLHTYAWGGHPVEPYDWALRFEAVVRERIEAREHAPLIDYPALGRDALLSVPTPEHYLPLLYVLGASVAGEPVGFPVQGIDGGSVSMLAVRCG
ncbi:MAG TPA: 4,5-DOPA dioxygenase extradiol [Steroidobacteraceae bacterium]|nr:4,5-DOPA dioxygenase extradiol [Steroidobacteraceae bacterium]